jgi:hypothetical protein
VATGTRTVSKTTLGAQSQAPVITPKPRKQKKR